MSNLPLTNDVRIFFVYTECDYFGTIYVFGQHFVGTDGCSNCYCGANGEFTCDNSPCSKCTYSALSITWCKHCYISNSCLGLHT